MEQHKEFVIATELPLLFLKSELLPSSPQYRKFIFLPGPLTQMQAQNSAASEGRQEAWGVSGTQALVGDAQGSWASDPPSADMSSRQSVPPEFPVTTRKHHSVLIHILLPHAALQPHQRGAAAPSVSSQLVNPS